MVTRDKTRPPVHPGEILREDILPSLEMSVTAAAGILGVSRQTLHRILAESAAISPEMALRIGKFCGNGPDVWIRMQAAYDLWHAEKKIGSEIAGIKTQNAA